ncbi:hypothetical protein GCM10010228_29810 [Streptomyces massasporeus]|nr:hypothetical protein GCM10010228_29810 [Streptomyces massasporeus]
MTGSFRPDFGLTARDYGRHRAGFPPQLVSHLYRHGIAFPGKDVLDVGTGTGALARLFALAGARVTGLDPAGPCSNRPGNSTGKPGWRSTTGWARRKRRGCRTCRTTW